MIVVRDVFRLKFGKAKDVKELMKEFKTLPGSDSMKNMRVLFDLVGPSYTMVLEGTYKNLADYETSMSTGMGEKEWQSWYQRFIPNMEKAYREIFTVFE